MTTLITTVRTTCRGRTEGNARCRKMVDGYGCCPAHKGKQLAPPPNIVLLKAKVNAKVAALLWGAAGVERKERDRQREQELDQKHRQEAEKLGRSATAYRTKPDSGAQVFGKDGALNVSVSGLWDELESAGYRPQDIHLYQKPDDHRGMEVLTVEFVLAGEDNLDEDTRELCRENIAGSAWGYAHIWTNPAQPDGRVLHTVNLAHRLNPEQARANLVFDHGHWALAEL